MSPLPHCHKFTAGPSFICRTTAASQQYPGPRKKHSIQPLVTNTLALAKFVVVFLARTIQRARQLGIGPFTEAQPNPIQPTRGNYCAVAIRRVLLMTLCLHITVTAARKVTQRGSTGAGAKSDIREWLVSEHSKSATANYGQPEHDWEEVITEHLRAIVRCSCVHYFRINYASVHYTRKRVAICNELASRRRQRRDANFTIIVVCFAPAAPRPVLYGTLVTCGRGLDDIN